MFADPWATEFLEVFFFSFPKKLLYHFTDGWAGNLSECKTLKNVLDVIEPKEKQIPHPHEVGFLSNPSTMHRSSEAIPPRKGCWNAH